MNGVALAVGGVAVVGTWVVVAYWTFRAVGPLALLLCPSLEQVAKGFATVADAAGAVVRAAAELVAAVN